MSRSSLEQTQSGTPTTDAQNKCQGSLGYPPPRLLYPPPPVALFFSRALDRDRGLQAKVWGEARRGRNALEIGGPAGCNTSLQNYKAACPSLKVGPCGGERPSPAFAPLLSPPSRFVCKQPFTKAVYLFVKTPSPFRTVSSENFGLAKEVTPLHLPPKMENKGGFRMSLILCISGKRKGKYGKTSPIPLNSPRFADKRNPHK